MSTPGVQTALNLPLSAIVLSKRIRIPAPYLIEYKKYKVQVIIMKTVVLGASRGLGLVLCEHLALAGHQVMAGVRNAVPQALLTMARQHSSILPVIVDVTNEQEMGNAADYCLRILGQVDYVIYVAGVILPEDRASLLHELPLKVLRETFEINTFGAINAIKHFYPIINKNTASAFILITSEGCGVHPSGSWIPAYSLSKCAQTKIASIMNASVDDVRFYAIHPGRMNTDMGRLTQQIEPEETAASLTKLLENGDIHQKNTWYMDYMGNSLT